MSREAGIIIRKIRQEQGLSQQELADLLETTKSYISNIENGDTISISKLKSILDKMGYGLILKAEKKPEKKVRKNLRVQ